MRNDLGLTYIGFELFLLINRSISKFLTLYSPLWISVTSESGVHLFQETSTVRLVASSSSSLLIHLGSRTKPTAGLPACHSTIIPYWSPQQLLFTLVFQLSLQIGSAHRPFNWFFFSFVVLSSSPVVVHYNDLCLHVLRRAINMKYIVKPFLVDFFSWNQILNKSRKRDISTIEKCSIQAFASKKRFVSELWI